MISYKDKLCLLRKTAAGGYAATRAVAGDVRNVVDDAVGLHKWVSDKAMFYVPALMLAGAYGLHKLTKPTALTENSDDLLYLNTLKAEVAMARRELDALEAEKAIKNTDSKRVFDKFLG